MQSMIETVDHPKLKDLILSIFRCNGTLLFHADQTVEPFGLKGAQWQVLGAIGHSETPLSAPQIAKFMGITRQGVQKQLGVLKEKGLIQCCANPNNERSPLFCLTEEGRQDFQAIMGQNCTHLENLASLFESKELEITVNALHKFSQFLEEHSQSSESDDE